MLLPRSAHIPLVIAAAIAAAAPGPAHAGAWTQPKGSAYIKIAAAGLDTRTRFDRNGARVAFGEDGDLSSTKYRSRELRLYAEFGASDAVTLYGSAAYKDLAIEQVAASLESNGGSDVYAGVRYRVRAGSVPVSLAGEAKIPTGYDIDEQPALGAGTTDITGRLLVGTSFGKAYATGDVGFVYRSGRYRNEFVFSSEVGSRLFGPIYARTVLRGVRALGAAGAAQPGVVFDPGLSSPRMILLDGTVGLDVGDGVSLEGALSHVLNGRESLAGNTVEISLVMLWGAP